MATTNAGSIEGNDVGLRTYYPENADRIPETAGVYSFFYNPFRKGPLGLYRDHKPSASRIQTARDSLRKKLALLQALMDEISADLETQINNAGGQAQLVFSGRVASMKRTPLFDILTDLDDQSFVEFLHLAEAASVLLQPLYCGMTTDQSLRSRYRQHMADYNVGKAATFGGRLSGFNISWSDLVYQCVPVRARDPKADSVRASERLMICHALPLLNIRH